MREVLLNSLKLLTGDNVIKCWKMPCDGVNLIVVLQFAASHSNFLINLVYYAITADKNSEQLVDASHALLTRLLDTQSFYLLLLFRFFL